MLVKRPKRSLMRGLKQLYSVLMTLVAVALLGLFLACIIDGAVRLAIYEDLAGFGLMALGVPLYFGGALALAESDAARLR